MNYNFKKETIINHKRLWQGIIDYLKEGKNYHYGTFSGTIIKEAIFKRLFQEQSIRFSCWLCEEKYHNDLELGDLICKCPLLREHSCGLWDDFIYSLHKPVVDIRKSIKIAIQIRDIIDVS